MLHNLPPSRRAHPKLSVKYNHQIWQEDDEYGLGVFCSLQGYQTAQHLLLHHPHTVPKFELLDMHMDR